jgi:hypothetical protein
MKREPRKIFGQKGDVVYGVFCVLKNDELGYMFRSFSRPVVRIFKPRRL